MTIAARALIYLTIAYCWLLASVIVCLVVP